MTDRDGNLTSLWQDKADTFTATVQPSERRYDVAIVGGGITGITTALVLQQSGKSCIVFESRNLCFGTTGGTTAHLNTFLDTPYPKMIKNFGKDTARMVARATREAINQVAELSASANIDCGFRETNGYLIAQNDEEIEELQSIHDACLDLGVDVAYIPSLPTRLPAKKILMIRNQAAFNPVRYVHGLAEAFEQAGGVVMQGCHVEEVDAGEEVRIETSQGTFHAKTLIYATHIPPGINLLHLRCVPYRSYALALRLKGNEYPDGLLYDMKDPYHYYRSQEIDGINYMIVGGEDHKTGSKSETDSSFRSLEDHVRQHFDVQQITHYWSSQFFESVDGLPYIGTLPGHADNILVATGYGGNGITYSQVAALTLRARLHTGEDRYEGIFKPGRIKPAAGLPKFITHNAGVVKQLLRKMVGLDELEGLDRLRAGEGVVVRLHDEKIAVCRDNDGMLHAVNPTCTHMGCTVVWNSAEQTWDCPCHGARYSMEGKVITGPADQDLEQVTLGEPVKDS